MKLGLRPTALLTGLPLAGFITIALASQGCTVELTNTPSDGGRLFDPFDDDASAGDAGPAGNTDSCSRGLYSQCAAMHAACDTDKACTGIYNCAVQPGASVRGCIEAQPTGEPGYTALYKCDQRSACTTCTNECATNPIRRDCDQWIPVTPPPPQDSGPAPTPDAGPDDDAAPPPPPPDAGPTVLPCDSCLASKCANEKAACVPGSECQDYSGCVSRCVSGLPDKLDQCVDACGTVYPTGKSQGTALASCTNTNCRAECF